MTTDPRAALDRLVAALEAHLTAAEQRRGSEDPAVVHAYDTLADAFETYDEALFDSYGETTPFEIYDDDDLDDELGDEDDLELEDLNPDDDFDDHIDPEVGDQADDDSVESVDA